MGGEGWRVNEGRNFPSFSSQMEENILTQNRQRLGGGGACAPFSLLGKAGAEDESNHDVDK